MDSGQACCCFEFQNQLALYNEISHKIPYFTVLIFDFQGYELLEIDFLLCKFIRQ